MAVARAHRRAGILLITVMAVSAIPTPSLAVTRAQVNAACEDSKEQYDEYQAAQRRFEEAALAYEQVLNDVDRLERQQTRIQGSVDSNANELLVIEDQIEERAVQLYMQGGLSSPGIIFSASSVDRFLTTTEFLSSAALGGQASIDELFAARGELERFQVDLDGVHQELKVKETEANDLVTRQTEAMEAEQASYARLSSRCQELNAKYEAEQAAAAAAARQRAAGSVQVGSFICPFTPGRTSFINSWGFPRSGGRRHKGTDLFAAWNEPMYAVASGVVHIGNSGLGGKTIWLTGGNGVAFYYAHLADWNVSNGQRVSQGETIGYNGDSGNASGGAPHLHFEIHPGGRGSPAVNPYPTLVLYCR
jgi:murein DD-endopeptidase MepM/ murein hydrolase activator NlpD